MKNRFLNFLRRYWFCFLLSIIMVIGISLSTRYADLYKTGDVGDMIRFDLGELYLIYVIPLYSFVYGCLSYIILKKAWLPQLILGIVTFLYWFRFDIDALAWPGTFIWSAYPIAFSLFGTGITSLIYKMVEAIKENKVQKP